jgi:putative ABC transport system ATP-binding protein
MIRGPSGGGKTTLLNLIGTIDSSSSGQLYIMG